MIQRSIPLFAMVVAMLLTGCASTAPSREPVLMTTASGEHYIDAGPESRTAIVFVHGWASDHTVWDEQVETFRAGSRVLAVDLPGHGGSARGDEPWSMAMLARGIARAMDDAGVREAVLVGHSNGTPTVREFYRLYPGRTLGLVSVDGALMSVVEPAMLRTFLGLFEGDGYRDITRQIIDGSIPEGAPYKDKIREMVMRTPQSTLAGGIEAQLDPALWEPDPIDVPLLVINASAPMWDDEYRRFVNGLAPDLEYHTIPDVSHFLFLDRPETFESLLREWLRSHGLP